MYMRLINWDLEASLEDKQLGGTQWWWHIISDWRHEIGTGCLGSSCLSPQTGAGDQLRRWRTLPWRNDLQTQDYVRGTSCEITVARQQNVICSTKFLLYLGWLAINVMLWQLYNCTYLFSATCIPSCRRDSCMTSFCQHTNYWPII
jgi:hypothetical protein